MTNGFCRDQAHWRLAAALFLICSLSSPTFADGEIKINAIVEYEGKGQAYRTGVNRGTFVGAIFGQLSVEGETPPLHASNIVCPAMVVMDLQNDQQFGNGHCVITAEDGAQVFAEWSCRGPHMVECSGQMKLTGGTARLAGITGGGPLSARTKFRGLEKKSSRSISAGMFGRGVLILDGFILKIPSK
jgi:hypothetical protein